MKRVTQHTVKMTKALYEALGTLDVLASVLEIL